MVFFNLDISTIGNALINAGFIDDSSDFGVTVSDIEPTSVGTGLLWFSPLDNILRVYNGTSFQPVSLTAEQTLQLASIATYVAQAEGYADAAYQSEQNIYNMIVVTGAEGSDVTWNPTTKTLTIPRGVSGVDGEDGVGVPAGGTAGQILAKVDETDFNTQWVTAGSGGVTDHTLLTNIGTNTHADIDTALTRLANTSGTNTGDQDLSGYSLTSHNHAGVYEPANSSIAKINAVQTFTAAQRGSITTDNDLSFNLGATNNFVCTPTAGGEMTFTGLASGQSGNIIFINPSAYVITKNALVKAPSTFLTQISTAGTYWISYISDGTNVYVSTSSGLS